ncbi:hypothetical protein RIF29_01959 [Crotalaria pallida]|uniref:Uncharacterized protein n=1 Tax=Crotalaria pallida TaxID=3830 RepID=A0AAN9P8S3_CROPI
MGIPQAGKPHWLFLVGPIGGVLAELSSYINMDDERKLLRRKRFTPDEILGKTTLVVTPKHGDRFISINPYSVENAFKIMDGQYTIQSMGSAAQHVPKVTIKDSNIDFGDRSILHTELKELLPGKRKLKQVGNSKASAGQQLLPLGGAANFMPCTPLSDITNVIASSLEEVGNSKSGPGKQQPSSLGRNSKASAGQQLLPLGGPGKQQPRIGGNSKGSAGQQLLPLGGPAKQQPPLDGNSKASAGQQLLPLGSTLTTCVANFMPCTPLSDITNVIASSPEEVGNSKSGPEKQQPPLSGDGSTLHTELKKLLPGKRKLKQVGNYKASA